MKKKNQELTPKQKKVLNKFVEMGVSNPLDVAKKLGYTESAYIYCQIKSLVRKKKMKRIEGLDRIYYKAT